MASRARHPRSNRRRLLGAAWRRASNRGLDQADAVGSGPALGEDRTVAHGGAFDGHGGAVRVDARGDGINLRDGGHVGGFGGDAGGTAGGCDWGGGDGLGEGAEAGWGERLVREIGVVGRVGGSGTLVPGVGAE